MTDPSDVDSSALWCINSKDSVPLATRDWLGAEALFPRVRGAARAAAAARS